MRSRLRLPNVCVRRPGVADRPLMRPDATPGCSVARIRTVRVARSTRRCDPRPGDVPAQSLHLPAIRVIDHVLGMNVDAAHLPIACREQLGGVLRYSVMTTYRHAPSCGPCARRRRTGSRRGPPQRRSGGSARRRDAPGHALLRRTPRPRGHRAAPHAPPRNRGSRPGYRHLVRPFRGSEKPSPRVPGNKSRSDSHAILQTGQDKKRSSVGLSPPDPPPNVARRILRSFGTRPPPNTPLSPGRKGNAGSPLHHRRTILVQAS